MEHAMSVRATSFAAAAGVMSLAAIAALTATFTNFALPAPPAPAPIDMFRLPDPPPPDVPRTQTPPPVSSDTFEPTPLPVEEPQRIEQISTQPVIGDPIGPPMIMNPRWLRTPRDLARYYPRRAMERGVEGQVVLDCLVTTSGALNCAVVSETPANWGFGEAALRISRDYQMAPATRDGTPVEGRYRMVAPFRLE